MVGEGLRWVASMAYVEEMVEGDGLCGLKVRLEFGKFKDTTIICNMGTMEVH